MKITMHRLLLLLALIASVLAPTLSRANPIEPEKAFAMRAQALDAQTVEVVFEVAKDYYLYGDKFRFEAEPAEVTFGTPEKPIGKKHKDDFFGEVETHRGELRILLPVQAPAGVTRFELFATVQGCWDGGICYPPTTQQASIDLSAPPKKASGGFLASVLGGGSGTAAPSSAPAAASSASAAASASAPPAASQVSRDETQKTYYAHFSLVALLKDPQGKVVRKFQRDIPYSGPIDKLELFEAGSFIYSEPFEAGPGRYLLETALADRISGKIGARRANIVLAAPPPDKASISSLALIRRVEPVEGPDAKGDPFRFPGGKVPPPLVARTPAGPGAQISIYCVIYTGGPGAPKPQLFMEFIADGQSLGKAEAPLPDPDASGAMPYIANIPAAQWPAGQYEVKATVVQAGAVVAEETAAFAIVPAP